MPFSNPEKSGRRKARGVTELSDFTQLGLDFVSCASYSNPPRKEMEFMNHELIETLENRIGSLVEKYIALKEENARLKEENQRFTNDREGIKSRVDAILGKLDGI